MKVNSIILFLAFTLVFESVYSNVEGLEIKSSNINIACMFFNGKPVIAFGPSPQGILTFLPQGDGNNILDWVKWAKRYGMTNVRSYPPSFIVDSPAENIFLRAKDNPNKFNLRKFNKKYFDELKKSCQLLNQNGIVVHLQLWQAVTWNNSWDVSYYNPENNINADISAYAGPKEFVTMENPVLLEHQKEYVRMILDSTAHIGNVFFDIMNEIGNGTGKSEKWVWEIIKTVNKWEEENNIDVLLTLNDEGGARMGKFSMQCKGLDLIVKDLGRYDEHIDAKNNYNKPTVSVRNIDWDYKSKERRYFYGYYSLEVNEDDYLQVRGRKYWWRMFMAGVQSAGGYSDAYRMKDKNIVYKGLSKIAESVNMEKFLFPKERKSSYRLNLLSENNFASFIKFVENIKGYENLIPSHDILHDHPVHNSYCLQDKNQVIIYLESPNGQSGYHYKPESATVSGLLLKDNKYEGYFYFPSNGRGQSFEIEIEKGKGNLQLPSFSDDLVITITTIE